MAIRRNNPEAQKQRAKDKGKKPKEKSTVLNILSGAKKDGFQLTSSTYKKYNKEIIATIESLEEGIVKSHHFLKGDIDKINILLHDLISKNQSDDDKQQLTKELSKLKSDYSELKNKQDDLQEKNIRLNQIISNTKKELEDANAISNNIRSIIESTIVNIAKEKADNKIVRDIIDDCKNNLSHSFYALFLLERLKDAHSLQDEHNKVASKVFDLQFEGRIAQLISISICDSINKKELSDEQIKDLVGYINSNFKKWEIIPIENEKHFDDHTEISVNPGADSVSKITKVFSFPIKISKQDTSLTKPTLGLVEAR